MAKHVKPQFYHRLEGYSDDDLYKMTKRYLYLSGEAADRPRSFYHHFVTKIYGEWERRGRVDLFEQAGKEVKKR